MKITSVIVIVIMIILIIIITIHPSIYANDLF